MPWRWRQRFAITRFRWKRNASRRCARERISGWDFSENMRGGICCSEFQEQGWPQRDGNGLKKTQRRLITERKASRTPRHKNERASTQCESAGAASRLVRRSGRAPQEAADGPAEQRTANAAGVPVGFECAAEQPGRGSEKSGKGDPDGPELDRAGI